MSEDFGFDLLMAFLSAVFAAVLTAVAAYGAYRLELRNRQREAVRHLAHVLASRRALEGSLKEMRVDTSDPKVRGDLDSCQYSVRFVRDSVVEVNRSVRPGSPAQHPLDEMTQAANRFLSQSKRDPDGYWKQLNELRTKLDEGVNRLGDVTKQSLPAPGSRI